VVIALATTASLLFAILLAFSVYCFIRRRRQQRARREALLAPPPSDAAGGGGAPGAPVAAGDGAVGGAGEGEGEGEVLHHAWHIRTVGLDEAAIESIALARYRAGAGMLGATDCPVCLGEFRDGELLRLLPKCGHAFHVPCIDAWLRAHVNCPLCRAHVLHPADADADAGDGERVPPPAGANGGGGGGGGAATDQASSPTDQTADQENPGQQQQGEQHELRVQIDRRDQPSSPEPPRRSPDPRSAQSFRRVASMGSRSPPAPSEDAPEDEQTTTQSSKEKQGSGGDSACCGKAPSGSGRLHHMRRSFSGGGGRRSLPSRHGRTSSSMLPL
jgi:hypothetical protein